MSFYGTMVCDGCGEEYPMEGDMEMPPYWIGLQIAIADQHGMIPEDDYEYFVHFCSQKCATAFMGSDGFREQILTVDKKESEDHEPDSPTAE